MLTLCKPFRAVLGGLMLAALPSTVLAELADLSEGRFVMYESHWSDDAAAFVAGPPPGSETACFRVGKTTPEGVPMTLASGVFFLWWSEESVTEYDDIWFSSDRFNADHPGQPPLEELRILFRNVEACR